MTLRVLCLVLLSATPALAQTYYIRDGGSASTTGTGACVSTGTGDWNTANACDQLPATLVRGATYLFADGSYSGKTITTAVNGTQQITLQKASVASHGTSTGWLDTYGDGTATFTSLFIAQTNYLTFNGAYRLECTDAGQLETTSCWRTGYGFKVDTGSDGFLLGTPFSLSVTNITIQYVEIEGSGITDGSVLDRGIYSTDGSSDVTIARSYIHDTDESTIYLFDTDNATVEYTWLARNCLFPTHCEGIVANEGTNNMVVRWSIFEDIGSTAYIGTPTGGHPQCGGTTQSNWYIYGNVFWRGASTRAAGAGILYVFDHNHTGDLFFYNNTIVDQASGFVGAESGGGADGCVDVLTARNNLFVTVTNSGISSANVTTFTVTHNAFWGADNSESGTSVYQVSGDPLTDENNADFGLTSSAASAMDAGTTLGSPYNTDMFGNTRGADGKWDRGAVEFAGGAAPGGAHRLRFRTP